jgi:hypothetical protein
MPPPLLRECVARSVGPRPGGNNPILITYGVCLFGAYRRRCSEAATVVDIEVFPDAAE